MFIFAALSVFILARALLDIIDREEFMTYSTTRGQSCSCPFVYKEIKKKSFIQLFRPFIVDIGGL